MNIKITYNWLREYLDTDADAYELQKYLSLCGASIEHVIPVEDDWALDIEITSNRIDMASVWGIAQEAAAILPRFGKKAHLRSHPLDEKTSSITQSPNSLPLTLTISDSHLASCARAIILDRVEIQPSPEIIQKRLRACDIRPINNVVDITNYVMLALGQPTHVFDYDKIQNATMLMRASQAGEKITTLDGKSYTLPGDDIVIEDGSGTIIDLCGIMGGQNSAVDEHTKRVVFFAQTYNKRLIRTTSMKTSARSIAASYFEKGLDEARVDAACAFALELFAQNAHATYAGESATPSKEYEPRIITTSRSFIVGRIGHELSLDECAQILRSLGMEVTTDSNDQLSVTVPSWRKYDIELPVDIVEEVARIYGFHNLENILPPPARIQQPKEIELQLSAQTKIGTLLKHLGYHESVNYSMISKEMIEWLELEPAHHLELEETMSEEWKYMRISLLPSMIALMKQNYTATRPLRFFEIAKVYYPQTNDLPHEIYKVALASNDSFEALKGDVESICHELNIRNLSYAISEVGFFAPRVQVNIMSGQTILGTIGRLKKSNAQRVPLKEDVYLASLDLKVLIDDAHTIPNYRPFHNFAVIRADVTLDANGQSYTEIVAKIQKVSTLVDHIEYITSYKETMTLRLSCSLPTRNIQEEDVQNEIARIKQALA